MILRSVLDVVRFFLSDYGPVEMHKAPLMYICWVFGFQELSGVTSESILCLIRSLQPICSYREKTVSDII